MSPNRPRITDSCVVDSMNDPSEHFAEGETGMCGALTGVSRKCGRMAIFCNGGPVAPEGLPVNPPCFQTLNRVVEARPLRPKRPAPTMQVDNDYL
jgi:hypothetical protein